MATTKSAAAKTASKTSSKSKGATASRKKPAGKPASPKKRAAAPRSSRKAKSAGDEEVTIDRRRNGRRGEESVESAAKPAPALERRAKVQRRRQIDPTTCERDYSDAEVEFMNAMDQYKRTSGRMFPTCSEVLEVIRSLGYLQLTPAELELLGRDEQSEAEEVVAGDEADCDSEELELAECEG